MPLRASSAPEAMLLAVLASRHAAQHQHIADEPRGQQRQGDGRGQRQQSSIWSWRALAVI
jgi:hypothetical protein